MELRVSTPLQPLAARMRELATSAARLDVMTAFVSADALHDTVGPAVERGIAIRFLTGTFGNVTRAVTFRRLHRLAQRENVAVRIWDCGTHRNLHAKFYIWWRTDGGATVWIGSANLTNGGLQNEGELIAELVFAPSDPAVVSMGQAFEHEWLRGDGITSEFLDKYREAPRSYPFRGIFRRRRTPPSASLNRVQRMFVVTASVHYSDAGPVAERMGALLGGTAQASYRGRSATLNKVCIGDWCLVFDTIDEEVVVAAVTDVVRDGEHVVFTYEPLWDTRKLETSLRDELGALGLRRSTKAIAAQWVPQETILAVVRAVHSDAGWDDAAPVVKGTTMAIGSKVQVVVVNEGEDVCRAVEATIVRYRDGILTVKCKPEDGDDVLHFEPKDFALDVWPNTEEGVQAARDSALQQSKE